MTTPKIGVVTYLYQIKQNMNYKNLKTPKNVKRKHAVREQVFISSDAKGIKRYKDIISRLPDVRKEKVEPLKNAIEHGIYQVNSERVAIKMLQEFSLFNLFK